MSGNPFELDGRGPSERTLLVSFVAFLVVIGLGGALMYAKSVGALDPRVQIVASMFTVGDGLPTKSDVKFRGVLVGMVRSVDPALTGEGNTVAIDLKPQYASQIPATVTARVVPGNAFAVSTVQLVDNGLGGPAIRTGDVITQDQSLPTQLFQTTLARLRELVGAAARPGNDRTIGLMQTISDATAGKGPQLTSAAQGLGRIVEEMNQLRVDESGPPAIATWTAAIDALRSTAPDLLDALDGAITPMRTVAEQQAALTNLLTGANHTVATMGTAMDNHTDTLVDITTNLSPVVGVLAQRANKFPAIGIGINNVVNTFFDQLWTRTGQKVTFTFKLVVSLAPLRIYTRADCPRYAQLQGPSCHTAPEFPVGLDPRGGLPDPRSYVPPPGTVLTEETTASDDLLLGAVGVAPLPAEEPAGGTP